MGGEPSYAHERVVPIGNRFGVLEGPVVERTVNDVDVAPRRIGNPASKLCRAVSADCDRKRCILDLRLEAQSHGSVELVGAVEGYAVGTAA